MPKFRYSDEELREFTDYKMLYCTVHDRMVDVRLNTPLWKRLQKLHDKLYSREELTK
jgi:hypothetical protein